VPVDGEVFAGESLPAFGEGLQVLVYCPDQPDLFARICGFFDTHNFSILDAKVHTTRNGWALDSFVVVEPNLAQHYRDLISMLEVELARTLAARGPLPEPVHGRVSRRVRHFPVQPRVELRPDERGQRDERQWWPDGSGDWRPDRSAGPQDRDRQDDQQVRLAAVPAGRRRQHRGLDNRQGRRHRGPHHHLVRRRHRAASGRLAVR
jgi:hypothetical protein